jgi:hypothetical protein
MTQPEAPFLRRAAAALRAGAFAAGAGLVVFEAVDVEGRSVLLHERAPMVAWLGGTLALLVVLVWLGCPSPRRGQPLVERAFIAVLSTVAILATATSVTSGLGIAPSQTRFAVGGLLLVGAIVSAAFAARASRVDRTVRQILEEAPHRGPIAWQEPSEETPRLTAAECERDAPAVEVRALWGGDLLRVFHLDPPRSFHVGETGCDLAVDAERLGAPRVQVVEVASGAVSLTLPPGASGTLVRASGESEALANATAATPIPLTKGMRVALTFRAAGSAYRAASSGENAPASPLVLEVALVNAGRVVGRSASLRNDGRLLASTGLVACVVFAGLVVAATPPPPRDAEEEAAFVLALQVALEDADRREFVAAVPDHNDDSQEREGGFGARGSVQGPQDNAGIPVDEFCASLPLASEFSGGLCRRNRFLGVGELREEMDLAEFLPRPRRSVGTLGGCHSCGTLAGFGTGHGRLGGRPRTGPPKVHIGVLEVSAGIPPELVHRAVRRGLGNLRSCYADGLLNNPNLQGKVTTRLVIGRDGTVSSAVNGGSDMPDGGVIVCVFAVFRELSFPAPEAAVATVTAPIVFSPPD